MPHANQFTIRIEEAAEQLLNQFNPVLLKEPQSYDVYAVIEKCLGVEYDWKYIRPDQSILGLTAFDSGYFWVSPTPHFYKDIQPQKIYLKKGTILIDSTLTESSNIGRERFTVMHEVFHQVLHQDIFNKLPDNFVHATTATALFGKNKQLRTSLDFIEHEANAGAAAFLMPRKTLPTVWKEITGYSTPVPQCAETTTYISEMAQIYQVSKQAMKYRLLNTGILISA